VSFKRIFGEATYGQVSFFFSLIGLLNVVLLWPIVLTLHFTGLEVITWNRVPWIQLAVAGSLSLGTYQNLREIQQLSEHDFPF
jgi:solute carrier family 35 protein F3/4